MEKQSEIICITGHNVKGYEHEIHMKGEDAHIMMICRTESLIKDAHIKEIKSTQEFL